MKTLLLSIGIVLIILGVIAMFYTVTTTDDYLGGLIEDTDTERPYNGFSIPLLIIGIVIVIIGIIVPSHR